MARAIARLLIGIVLALFFAASYCTLRVHRAFEQGALDLPWRCINASQFDRYKAGAIEQFRMDGILASQVRDHYLAGRRVGMGRWHLLGGMAELGIKLGYTPAERRAMAMKVISRAPLCPQDLEKYRKLHGGSAASPAPDPDALLGDWAILDHQPTANALDNCASDNGISLGKGGRYTGLFESGSWRLDKSTLHITVTAANDATGGEGPEQRLDPPRLHDWEIADFAPPAIRVQKGGHTFWLYRCAKA